MPTKDQLPYLSNVIFRPIDSDKWNELPTLSEPLPMAAHHTDHEFAPSHGNFSFTATCSGEFPKHLLYPNTKLPRKLKKAAKTLYFARHGRDFTIRINPTPRTKAQRRIARKCAWDEIMTPKGEILKIGLE